MPLSTLTNLLLTLSYKEEEVRSELENFLTSIDTTHDTIAEVDRKIKATLSLESHLENLRASLRDYRRVQFTADERLATITERLVSVDATSLDLTKL